MNKVYIAQSLDGYLSDKNNELAWLEMIPNPDGDNMGYDAFMTTFPILLGGGRSLFGDLDSPITLKHIKTEVLLEQITQSTYIRKN